ncbi:hypothetical protein K488DRAFT_71404 [Vararia minispora EC-137]|uniref:Uncharacterized protein n=1 Tax=Vararia minispora EC-137 TaxID=1314806 RepID=A0ACB8QIJ6_9AGAM|nr:hypothetical protein K488DRAFT_71404 [Vararia minispora EC-137]
MSVPTSKNSETRTGRVFQDFESMIPSELVAVNERPGIDVELFRLTTSSQICRSTNLRQPIPLSKDYVGRVIGSTKEFFTCSSKRKIRLMQTIVSPSVHTMLRDWLGTVCTSLGHTFTTAAEKMAAHLWKSQSHAKFTTCTSSRRDCFNVGTWVPMEASTHTRKTSRIPCISEQHESAHEAEDKEKLSVMYGSSRRLTLWKTSVSPSPGKGLRQQPYEPLLRFINPIQSSFEYACSVPAAATSASERVMMLADFSPTRLLSK